MSHKVNILIYFFHDILLSYGVSFALSFGPCHIVIEYLNRAMPRITMLYYNMVDILVAETVKY